MTRFQLRKTSLLTSAAYCPKRFDAFITPPTQHRINGILQRSALFLGLLGKVVADINMSGNRIRRVS